MRPLIVLVLAAALLSFTPLAAAAPPCAAEQPDAPAYVVGTSVWRETNNVPGLQRAACEDDSGRPVAADQNVASVPPIPQGLCVTIPVLNLRICAI